MNLFSQLGALGDDFSRGLATAKIFHLDHGCIFPNATTVKAG